MTSKTNGFKKQKHNPIGLAQKLWPEIKESHLIHIELDEKLKPHHGQFDIVRQSGHDGTLLFTLQMLQDVLINPINMQSHFKGDDIDFDKLKSITYKVGMIYHSTVFGRIKLKSGGVHYGQVERARMPVICEYIY